MTVIEADRRAHANILNAPDAIAGQELVAAHREAAWLAGLKAAIELYRDDPEQIARDTSPSPDGV